MLLRSKRKAAAVAELAVDASTTAAAPEGELLQRMAYSALLYDDLLGMRNVLGLLDLKHTAGPVLGLRVENVDGTNVSLLGYSLFLGRTDHAVEILRFLEAADPEVLRECLRDADDGRSVMQLAARWPSDGNEEEGGEGIRDTSVDLLHAAYFRLAEAEGKDTLDREKVDVPYAKYYDEILHPGPPEDPTGQTDEFPPRLSIVVSAHGSSLVEEVFDTPRRSPRPKERFGGMKSEDIAMLYYGPGLCDVSTVGSTSSSHDFERTVWEATRPHASNTFATMQQLQQQLRELYLAQTKDSAINREQRETNSDVAAVLDANAHCRIAHPDLDRRYTYMKYGSALRMVQCFNSPYNDLVGRNLFGPEMRSRMRVHHPAVAKFVDVHMKSFITYRGTVRRLHLSMIASVMSLIGFKVMNVYDYACRDFSADSDAARGTIKGTPDRRKNAARRVTEREDEKPVKRAFGGGGGGTTTTRRRRRKEQQQTAAARTGRTARAKPRRRRCTRKVNGRRWRRGQAA